MCWHIIRWNPKYFAWNDLYYDIQRLKAGADVIKRWECRGPNCIKSGNGFFLVRQGEDPKGIMGCGAIKECRSCPGCNNPFIFDLRFEILALPDKNKMLTREYLRYMFPYVYWDTPKTGSVIADDVAEILHNELLRKMKEPDIPREFILNYAI